MQRTYQLLSELIATNPNALDLIERADAITTVDILDEIGFEGTQMLLMSIVIGRRRIDLQIPSNALWFAAVAVNASEKGCPQTAETITQARAELLTYLQGEIAELEGMVN